MSAAGGVDHADILGCGGDPGERQDPRSQGGGQEAAGARVLGQGRPREWLARADGAVQEARTEGSDLVLFGEPVPYHPGRAERRSGVPTEVITADRVPNSCTCSWAYAHGKLTLKHYNASCTLHADR